MKPCEDNTHSFIVRIRLEHSELNRSDSEWRGMVEHVESGKRRYLKDLEEIISFIASYLHRINPNGKAPSKFSKLRNLWKSAFRKYH